MERAALDALHLLPALQKQFDWKTTGLLLKYVSFQTGS